MSTPSWNQRLGTGALAGLGGGAVSAVLFWLLVEPSINRAIAIEQAGSGDDGHAHSHDVVAGAAHDHGETVTRFQQQLGGTLTVVLVAALLGVAFSVVYAKAQHRMIARTDLGRSLALAALAFGAMALVPALVMPANPPAVGDPATVDQRTLTYLLTILASVVAIGVVFAIRRFVQDRAMSDEWRWLLTGISAAAAIALVLTALPRMEQAIPSSVPAYLIWEFRIGSLAQLAGMWLAIGLLHGARAHRLSRTRVHRVMREQTLV